MPSENIFDRDYKVTQPFDPSDPPRFGQLTETVKDVFVKELTDYFSINNPDLIREITEVPNIQKFSVGQDNNSKFNLAETINVIIKHGDVLDKFPMIAITIASNREKRLGIGNNFSTHVQDPPNIEGTKEGPYNIDLDHVIELTTWPLGVESSAITSTISFTSGSFYDNTLVSIDQLVKAINMQALYYTAEKTIDGKLSLLAGGKAAKHSPNYIEVTDGDQDLLDMLGLTIGQSDSYLNPDNPPKNRYYTASDMVINVDVIGDDLNIRTELSDLIYHFFTFVMEKRRFEFLGRSYREKVNPEEWFHLVLNNEFNWSGEYNTNRQVGDSYDYIYATRGSVSLMAIDYINRELTSNDWLLRDNIMPSDNAPVGDYGGTNFRRIK